MEIKSEEQKEKRLKKSEQRLSGSDMPCGIPRRRREKGAERIFEEMLAENFPNLLKGMNINIQEVQWTPIR